MNVLLDFDHNLFYFINSGLQNSFFNFLMPILRNSSTWIPFYLFFILFLIFNFRPRKSTIYTLFILSCVLISDFTSSTLIKKAIKRERPCRVFQSKEKVNVLVHCGSGYSFTSSHASNHFSLALFLFLTLAEIIKKYKWLLIIWATAISFAQIYVGVHFPLDVIAGAFVGTVVGILSAKVYLHLPHEYHFLEAGHQS